MLAADVERCFICHRDRDALDAALSATKVQMELLVEANMDASQVQPHSLFEKLYSVRAWYSCRELFSIWPCIVPI